MIPSRRDDFAPIFWLLLIMGALLALKAVLLLLQHGTP